MQELPLMIQLLPADGGRKLSDEAVIVVRRGQHISVAKAAIEHGLEGFLVGAFAGVGLVLAVRLIKKWIDKDPSRGNHS